MYVHRQDVPGCLQVYMCDCACLHALILPALFFLSSLNPIWASMGHIEISITRKNNLFMLFGRDTGCQMHLPLCAGAQAYTKNPMCAVEVANVSLNMTKISH